MIAHQTIRKKFLEFFTSSPRNHAEIPSASLVPENDPTVLFITAGMHPLVAYLLGQPHPLGKRLVNIQKSIRTDDIEEVGDLRHFTFFEMLGNWSLGDYFKADAIAWSFAFLTDTHYLGFDPHRLYVSVFSGDSDAPRDDVSIGIWTDVFRAVGIRAQVGDPKNGVSGNARIFPYPKAKNWWGPAGQTGPCGPDTEMFFDTQLPHDSSRFPDPCHINCDCGRYVEVWNDVFMEYNKTDAGVYTLLSQKNVDTGMGMERVVALVSWLSGQIPVPDPFLTPLFSDTLRGVCSLAHISYSSSHAPSLRIIADHLRASVFALADGVIPSNKERGYIVRRLIRRAIRHGWRLGIRIPFLADLAGGVVVAYHHQYPELRVNQDAIVHTLRDEEGKFFSVLKRGMHEIDKLGMLDGRLAFDLYQSFGFPLEMTVDIAKERGQSVSVDAFTREFRKHQEMSRTAAKGMFQGGLQDHGVQTTKLHTATHLLQQALRDVLGSHVRQKGSHITADRLRFDFSHAGKLTAEEIRLVEERVNEKIRENLAVTKQTLPFARAQSAGALFVESARFPQIVTMYCIGDYSKEICAGPHVDFTGQLGSFKIIQEEAAGSRIRRIYARVDFDDAL